MAKKHTNKKNHPLYERIQERLKAAKTNLNELSRQSGVTRNTLSYWKSPHVQVTLPKLRAVNTALCKLEVLAELKGANLQIDSSKRLAEKIEPSLVELLELAAKQ